MASEETVSSRDAVHGFLRNPLTWIALAPLVILPIALLFIRSNAPRGPRLPVMKDAPAFKLQSQRGETFASDDLRGKVYIANFIFTRCEVVCPITTAKMRDVQKRLGPDTPIQLVSFSVDPQYDTPPRLRKYAARFGADLRNWTFLRGTRPDMKRIVMKGFNIGMGIIGIKDDSNTDTTKIDQKDMVHGAKFVLVDKDGQIRGYYNLNTDDDIVQLVTHAKHLAN